MNKIGSLACVIFFPSVWPQPNNITILKTTAVDAEIKIIGTSEGRLLVSVDESRFIGPKIKVVNGKGAMIAITWDLQSTVPIRLYIEGEPQENNVDIDYLLVGEKKTIDQKLSLEHDSVKKNCKEWMQWRKHRFSNLKSNPKAERKLKTIDDQFQELTKSVLSLRNISIMYANNEDLFTINSLPFLRSLLFWPDNNSNKNYNPLLLRLAGILELPLPIFAIKNFIQKIDNESTANLNFTELHFYDSPGLIKTIPNQVIMDFQDWLHEEVVSDKIENYKYRWKDILFEAANTIGSSHFDDDIPIGIDKLSDSFSFDRTRFYHCIKTITDITIELGEYIIREYKST